MGEDSSGHNSTLAKAAPRGLRGGLFAALVTSRRSGERRPNNEATAATAEWVCARGVDGVTLLGATGEFLDFEIAERGELVKKVVRSVNCPVVVNCSHSSLSGAVRLGREAYEIGASALMVMPPPFFHRPPSDVRAFFLQFAEQMGGRLPLILYNLPQFTDWIQYEIAEELLASGIFAAIKDSSGDVKFFDRLAVLKRMVTFRLYVGNDFLFSHGHRAGADGAISGCACAVPELLVALRTAVLKGDTGRAQKLDAQLSDFLKWLDRFPVPQGIREALAERCLSVGSPGAPMGEPNLNRLHEYREWLSGWLADLPSALSVVRLG